MIGNAIAIGTDPATETLSLHNHKCKINDYLLTVKIGSGSFSTAFLALDTNTNQQVAVERIRLRELARIYNGIGQLKH
jgi:serine/threonine protein kinase